MENKEKEDRENAIKWLNYLKDEIDAEYGSGKNIVDALNYAINIIEKVEK